MEKFILFLLVPPVPPVPIYFFVICHSSDSPLIFANFEIITLEGFIMIIHCNIGLIVHLFLGINQIMYKGYECALKDWGIIVYRLDNETFK